MKKLILLIMVIFTFVACNNKKIESISTIRTTPTESIEQVKTPSTIAGIKVYNSFTDFKPLLHQDNDTTYVVNFWATWCKPCVEELPYFEALNKEFTGTKQKMILVSLDFVGQTKKVAEFKNDRQLKSEVVHLNDANNSAWIDKVDTAWSGSIPATLVYNTKEKYRKFYEQSFHSMEQLRATLR